MASDFREIAEQHVNKIMQDARGPHTGNFAADCEAWPSSGMDAEELVRRTESLIALAVEATRKTTDIYHEGSECELCLPNDAEVSARMKSLLSVSTEER